MKKIFYFIITLSIGFVAISYSGPMESFKNYNVILVHGAGGSKTGLDCTDSIKKASEYERDANGYLKLTGGFGSYLFGLKEHEGSVEDMKELRPWLTDKVFDGEKSVVYLQRSFTNPANSPINNAKEIGYSKWQGNNKCHVRRSLIEEAQEVGAKGQDSLSKYRKHPKYHYQDSLLPPSRNILIAHSMGGVASREYVQSDSIYNNDVDKVITLDSPHEGTGALNMLLDMGAVGNRFSYNITNTVILSATTTGLLLVMSADELTLAIAGIFNMLSPLALNATTFGMGQLLIETLGYHYQPGDSLAAYIDPSRSTTNSYGGIGNLKNRPYTDSLPMMRLLSGKNSMTFSDPNKGKAKTLNHLLPKAIASSYYNMFSQISGGGSGTVDFINSVTAFDSGLMFGVTIGEHGTALIPEYSSMAENTAAFGNPSADVMKRQYDGHVFDDFDGAIKGVAATTFLSAATIVSLSYLDKIFPIEARALKAGIAIMVVATVASGALDLGLAFTSGVNDLMDSHLAPTMKEHLNKWKADANAYTKITGEKETITPYRMEEFLYEKPFANVRIKSSYSSDWKDTLSDTLGLYIGDSLEPLYIAKTLENFTPLKFKSTSDWEIMGAKKERWEMTKGVGDEKIPIRHADRYPMPPVMVKDFIKRYEFEIDDLMPHRLRQIRLNFNFNEELAWECDINKDSTDVTACIVFKHAPASNGWDSLRTEKHPVNEKGIFVFEPENYYKNVGLGAIQKDNLS